MSMATAVIRGRVDHVTGMPLPQSEAMVNLDLLDGSYNDDGKHVKCFLLFLSICDTPR